MRLLINGLCLPVAQMGTDFLLLDDPVNHLPTVATIVMQIDKNERRWNVLLPNGISTERPRVEIAAVR